MCSDSYHIPILSPILLYHPHIPYFLIQRFFLFSTVNCNLLISKQQHDTHKQENLQTEIDNNGVSESGQDWDNNMHCFLLGAYHKVR